MQIGCCNDIRRWSNTRALDDARHDILEIGGLMSEFGAVRVSMEERLNPIVDVIRYEEFRKLFQNGTVTDGVKCLGKIKCKDNDVRIGFKEC
jgi:hypothetical protein